MRNEKGQFVKGHKTWLGKHHTQESKRKMSESQKGKSLGFIPKMAFKKGDIPWSKGKTFSKQYRKKISEGHKGQIPWSKGKKLSKEHKQKIKLVHIGKHYSPKTEFKKDHIVPKGKDHWGWKGGKQEVNCLICKKTILREKWELKRNKGFLCSKECKSLWMSSRTKEKHPRYKGKWETSDGYVLVHLPEHPFSDKAGYVKEHRLIVEKFIGRYLKSEEVVHHIDENPSNNSIHNLMLFPSHSKHMSFHHKMTQFGMTNPIKGQIKDRWIPILKENQ